MALTTRWAKLMMLSVDEPAVMMSRKRPAPENQEEFDKYLQEVRVTGGFGVTSPYGHRISTGIRCVANTNLSDPTLQDLVRFAVEDYNQALPTDKHLCHVSTVKVNYQILPEYVLHYITLTVKFPAGIEKSCIALVRTCFEGCRSSGGLAFPPEPPRRPYFSYSSRGGLSSLPPGMLGYKVCESSGGQSSPPSRPLSGDEFINKFILHEIMMDSMCPRRKQDASVTLIDSENWKARLPDGAGLKEGCNDECIHIGNGTSIKFRPASYMSSMLVPQAEARDQDRAESAEFYKGKRIL